MEKMGLKVKGKSPDGKFVEMVDKQGRVKAKFHPPDKKTTYDHLHIYDSKGNPLNTNLKIVERTSPEAHIPLGGP